MLDGFGNSSWWVLARLEGGEARVSYAGLATLEQSKATR